MDALTQHLHTLFTDHEEKVFLDHFGQYVNLINKERFIINLDDAMKYIGFTRKDSAKRLVTKYFQEGDDYIIFKNESMSIEGGRPCETTLLSSDTFKEFCLIANTTNSRRIKSYYVKLEQAIMSYIMQNNERLQNLLDRKHKKKLYELGETLYVRQDTAGVNIFKVGSTNNMNRRQKGYGSHTLNDSFVYTLCCNDAKLMERVVHHHLRRYALPNKPDYFNLTLDEVVEVIRVSHYYIDIPYTRGSPWISPADTLRMVGASSKCALLARMEELVRKANLDELDTIPDIPDKQENIKRKKIMDTLSLPKPVPEPESDPKSELPGSIAENEEPAQPSKNDEEEKENQDLQPSTVPTNIESEAKLPPNPTDFSRFMSECTEVQDDAKAVWNEITCMYRLWSRCTEPRHAQLAAFFKERGFKKTHAYNPDTQVNATALLGFRLIPLKPLSFENPATNDYEAFLCNNCVRNVTGRVTKKELGEAFVAWKNDPTYTYITDADKTALFRLCASHSLQSTVHDGTRIREGFYGLSMIGKERVGQKLNSTSRKGVEQIDQSTGEVVNKFDSVTKAAMEVGLSISAISTAISSNRSRRGFSYRYA